MRRSWWACTLMTATLYEDVATELFVYATMAFLEDVDTDSWVHSCSFLAERAAPSLTASTRGG
jgi:hypothetical protein